MKTFLSVLSTNDYLPGALVINKCLQLVDSQYPFTILITPNISENSINILKKNNIQIKLIQNIYLKNFNNNTNIHWYFTFSKLNIFSQVEFEKIVYLDLDMIVTENLDHLFNNRHFSAVNSGGFIHKDWVDLNSGLIVFEPSLDIYNSLLNLLIDGANYKSDQDIHPTG